MSYYDRNRKPASLWNVDARFGELVRKRVWSLHEWAAALGTSYRRVVAVCGRLRLGNARGPARLTSGELLAVDRIENGMFLTPTERRYLQRINDNAAYARRRYGRD